MYLNQSWWLNKDNRAPRGSSSSWRTCNLSISIIIFKTSDNHIATVNIYNIKIQHDFFSCKYWYWSLENLNFYR